MILDLGSKMLPEVGKSSTGKVEVEYPYGGSGPQKAMVDTKTSVKLKITKFSDAGIELEVTKTVTKDSDYYRTKNNKIPMYSDTSVETTKDTYTSQIYGTYSGVHVSINQDQLVKIKEARKAAQESFYKNMAKSASLAVTNVALPGFSSVVAFVDSLSNTDAADFQKAFSAYIDKAVKRTPGYQASDVAVKFTKELQSYSEKLADLSTKAKDAQGNTIATYLDKGAWVLEGKDGSVVDRSSSHHTDFNAILRLREMDNNGAINFLDQARSGQNGYKIEGESYDKGESYLSMTNEEIIKSTGASKEIQDYLLGKSNLSLTEMNSKQLTDLTNALNDLPVKYEGESRGGSEVYRAYLADNFEY